MDNIILQKTVEIDNVLLNNNYIRNVLFLISGVFLGYILQPVPTFLNNLFNNSILFKFIILFIFGSTAVYPVNKNNILPVIFGSIITLILFEYLRTFN
jgi:hypothetical protein